jgi:CheY-like chemotaxis protein
VLESRGSRSENQSGRDGLKYKILIIDDSKDMRDLMMHLFKLEGYQVAQAEDGGQALQLLSADALPDLIFLDHCMDGMSAPEFLTELERTHPEILARVPIVMVTGLEPDRVTEKRVSEIIGKQVGIEPMLALAKHYLHKRPPDLQMSL